MRESIRQHSTESPPILTRLFQTLNMKIIALSYDNITDMQTD